MEIRRNTLRIRLLRNPLNRSPWSTSGVLHQVPRLRHVFVERQVVAGKGMSSPL